MRHGVSRESIRFDVNVIASSDGSGLVQLVLSADDDEVLPIRLDSESSRTLGECLITAADRSLIVSDDSVGDPDVH